MIAKELSYPRALELIDLLRGEDVEASVIVLISPKFSQVEIAKQICESVGAVVIKDNQSVLVELKLNNEKL